MKKMKGKWHERFIKVAELVASWSPDRSTQVGAVIVDDDYNIVSTGYNGFTRGLDPEERHHERPAKYEYTEHAERNAILAAARRGVSLIGTTMYQNWAPTACPDCARAIVQAGIKRMVGYNRPFGGSRDWGFSAADEILDNGGVERIVLDEEFYTSGKESPEDE